VVNVKEGSGDGKKGNQERIDDFCWVFKNSIALELSQIQSISLHFNSAHLVLAIHCSEQ